MDNLSQVERGEQEPRFSSSRSASPTVRGDVTSTPTKNEEEVKLDNEKRKDDPKAWSKSYKILHMAIISLGSFFVSWSASVYLSVAPAVAQEFGINQTESRLPFLFYVLAWAAGPLFLAPFGDYYGRVSRKSSQPIRHAAQAKRTLLFDRNAFTSILSYYGLCFTLARQQVTT